MAAPALTFAAHRRDIAQKRLAPVYLLHGEEGYYLDVLVKDFENVLSDADKEFNQYILYAPQVEPGTVMDVCYRYPMMAERQVVILKEAQAVNANTINRLHKYVQNPSSSTVLVIVFRGEKAKGKDLLAAAKAKGVVFESQKVKEWNLPGLIASYIKQKGLNADQKATEMLRDFIGTDLSRLYNEIDKLATLLGPNATITPEAVERNVGVSKEYNNFELIDASASKDAARAMRIVDYFAANPKAAPTVMTTSALYNFFSDLLVAMYSKDKSDQALMAALGLKAQVQLRKFQMGMRCYNAFQVIDCIWALRQFDSQSKGNGSRQDPYMLLRDLVFHLLTAPGNLGV